MAATGGEAADDVHFGSESLWIPAGGAAREEEKKGESRGREEVPNPGPTSMVVSWTVSMHQAPRGVVIEGGGSKPGPT